MAFIELTTLSSLAKLCLRTTIRSGGLVVGPQGYTGREAETGPIFATGVVWQLMALGLVRCAPNNDLLLEATNLGIELHDCGRAEIPLGPIRTTDEDRP